MAWTGPYHSVVPPGPPTCASCGATGPLRRTAAGELQHDDHGRYRAPRLRQVPSRRTRMARQDRRSTQRMTEHSTPLPDTPAPIRPSAGSPRRYRLRHDDTRNDGYRPLSTEDVTPPWLGLGAMKHERDSGNDREIIDAIARALLHCTPHQHKGLSLLLSHTGRHVPNSLRVRAYVIRRRFALPPLWRMRLAARRMHWTPPPHPRGGPQLTARDPAGGIGGSHPVSSIAHPVPLTAHPIPSTVHPVAQTPTSSTPSVTPEPALGATAVGSKGKRRTARTKPS